MFESLTRPSVLWGHRGCVGHVTFHEPPSAHYVQDEFSPKWPFGWVGASADRCQGIGEL